MSLSDRQVNGIIKYLMNVRSTSSGNTERGRSNFIVSSSNSSSPTTQRRDVTALVYELGRIASSPPSPSDDQNLKSALQLIRRTFDPDAFRNLPPSSPSPAEDSESIPGLALRNLRAASDRLMDRSRSASEAASEVRAAFLRLCYSPLLDLLIALAGQGRLDRWPYDDSEALIHYWFTPSDLLPATHVIAAVAPHIQDYSASTAAAAATPPFLAASRGVGVSVSDPGSLLAGELFAEHFLVPEARGLIAAAEDLSTCEERGGEASTSAPSVRPSLAEVAGHLATIAERYVE